MGTFTKVIRQSLPLQLQFNRQQKTKTYLATWSSNEKQVQIKFVPNLGNIKRDTSLKIYPDCGGILIYFILLCVSYSVTYTLSFGTCTRLRACISLPKTIRNKTKTKIKGTVPAFQWGYMIAWESRVLLHWGQHDFGYILLHL